MELKLTGGKLKKEAVLAPSGAFVIGSHASPAGIAGGSAGASDSLGSDPQFHNAVCDSRSTEMKYNEIKY